MFWLQMLLCMPEPFVCDYRPLVSEPKLMLEQLLMNMKVWGVPVVQKTSMACLFSFKQIRVGIYLFSGSLNYFFFFCKSTNQYRLKVWLNMTLCKIIKNKHFNNEFKIKTLSSGPTFKSLDFSILTFIVIFLN